MGLLIDIINDCKLIIISGSLIKRCLICGKRKNTQYVSDYGIYSSGWVYYHLECVKDVINNPEKHGHKKVDEAIWVTDLIEIKNKEENKIKHYLSLAKDRLKK